MPHKKMKNCTIPLALTLEYRQGGDKDTFLKVSNVLC
jgi:hypothetical protein